MTKAFMKILTIMITGLIFTFGLIGCTLDGNYILNSEVSYPKFL